MKQSWIDRLVDVIERARWPWWVISGLSWVVLSTLMAGVVWIAGIEDPGTYPRVTVLDPFYLVVPVLGYLYLTRYARRAFDRFRPALDMDESTLAGLRHRISSTPAHMAWIWLGVGGLGGAVSYLLDDGYYSLYMTTPLVTVTWTLLGFLGFGTNVVVAALIIRQVRLVAQLHRQAVHVDLFRPGPLHAFASLTARSGAFVLLNVAYSTLTDPTTFTNPVWRTVFFVASGIAAATFFLPLQGLARRLRVEKQTMLDDSSARLSALTTDLSRAIDGRSFAQVGDLRTSLAALGEIHERIRKVSPWPWDTGTIRGFATTLLIPLTTWFLTNLLNRVLF